MSDSDPLRPAELVDRLLGPAAAELSCEDCFEYLDAYVELEIEGRDADAAVAGMRAHLEGCPACREDHESLVALLASQRRRPIG